MSKTKFWLSVSETDHQNQFDSAGNSLKMASWVQTWRLHPNAFCPVHESRILHLPGESEAESYEVLHLSHKITLANSQDQHPDLPCFPRSYFLMCFAPQWPYMFPTPNFQKSSKCMVVWAFWNRNALCATTACTLLVSQSGWDVACFCTFWLQDVFSEHLNFQKWWKASKCALHPSGVHLANINFQTCSATEMFWLICFAPRRLRFQISRPRRLHTCRFGEPFVRACRAQRHTLPSFAFHLSILSEVRLLNFLDNEGAW